MNANKTVRYVKERECGETLARGPARTGRGFTTRFEDLLARCPARCWDRFAARARSRWPPRTFEQRCALNCCPTVD